MNENKTIAEVYEVVANSPELQREFLKAQENGAIEEFSAKLGCKVSAEEIEAFLKEKLSENKELSADELDQVAGGSKSNSNYLVAVFKMWIKGNNAKFR